MLKQKLSKLQYHLQKYGLLRTIQKVTFRVLKWNLKVSKSARKLYQNWIFENEPNEKELELQKKHSFEWEPKISVVVPMYNTNEQFFLELLNSLLAQTYSNWELCLADGSDKQNETIYAMCSRYSKIKYKFLDENKGISENTNEAIQMADGDFIAFLDHDDCLPPFSFYEIVKAINENPEVEFIYTDEDKINDKGERFDPYFKPDFSPETLECRNYITHFVIMKKNLVSQIGNLNSKFNGAQDFDFILRATENTKNIVHISKILYHWRAHLYSTAHHADAKNYAYEAGKKVVEEHLKRVEKKGIVESSKEIPGAYQIKYTVRGNPKVSIIILNTNYYKSLKKCLKSILMLTTYKNYEVLIVDHHSDNPKTFKYYEKVKQNPKVKIVEWKEDESNDLEAITFGIKNTEGDFVVQLAPNVKLLTPDWLELLIGYAQNQEIGAVGVRVYHSNKSIESVGMSCGVQKNAINLAQKVSYEMNGYFGQDVTIRNVPYISNACIFARREIFEKVELTDEIQLKEKWNNIDFCLKILEKGYRIVYNPFVELIYDKLRTQRKETK